MFADNLTLDNATGVDVVFNLVQQDGTGTVRRDVASLSATPRLLSIKHSKSSPTKTGTVTDQHLVQLVHNVAIADGSSVPITVNLTVKVPQEVEVTPALVKDDIAILLDLMLDGALVTPLAGVNIDKILIGES